MDGFEVRKGKDNTERGIVSLGTRDTVAIIAFILAILVAVVAYVVHYHNLWIFLLPFVIVGIVNYLLRGFYLVFVIAAAISLITWGAGVYILDSDSHMSLFLVLLAVFGVFGLTSMVDTFERAVFYPVLRRLRFANSLNASFGTRFVALIFDIRKDLDTRDVYVDLKVRDRVFPRLEIFYVVMCALVMCIIYWLYIIIGGYEPAVTDHMPFIHLGTLLNMATVASYAILITMPFIIFRVMDARIKNTREKSVRLYSGYLSTLQHMGLALLFLLLISIIMFIPKGMLTSALIVLIFSTAVTVILGAVTCVAEFYTMEVSTVSELAKKWKLFMPVSLLEDYRNAEDDDISGRAPTRDQTDFASIPFDVGRKRH